MWVQHNENPIARRTIDCTVRAIATAMQQDWDKTFVGLTEKAFELKDMPTANHGTVMLETTANERQSEECLTECKKQGKPCF